LTLGQGHSNVIIGSWIMLNHSIKFHKVLTSSFLTDKQTDTGENIIAFSAINKKM